MVVLVLDRPGELAIARDPDRLAAAVAADHDGVAGARAARSSPRARDSPRGPPARRTGGRFAGHHLVELPSTSIADLQRLPDLLRGQPGTGRRAHRLDHIVDEGAELLVEAHDRLADQAQRGMPELHDFPDGHRPPS